MKCKYCGREFSSRWKLDTHEVDDCSSRPCKPSPVKLSQSLFGDSCSVASFEGFAAQTRNDDHLTDFSSMLQTSSPRPESSEDVVLSSAVSSDSDVNTEATSTASSSEDDPELTSDDNMDISDIVRPFEQEASASVANLTYWKNFITSLSVFVFLWQILNYLSYAALDRFLYGFGTFLQLAAEHHPALLTFSALFPLTIFQLRKQVGVTKDSFVRYSVCQKCCRIFALNDLPNNYKCQCGHSLGHSTTNRKGKRIFKPQFTYAVRSLQHALEDFLKRPNIEKLCKSWQTRQPVEDGVLFDVFDGAVWKENSAYLNQDNTYAFLGNLDWFQPYERSNVSIGVFYLVCINLPRQVRFKMENVLVVSIIPYMGREPSALKYFMEPVITDFLSLYSGKIISTEEFPSGITVKGLLLGTSSDLPATRKLNGFLSYNAVKGCSKCIVSLPSRERCRSVRDYGTPFQSLKLREIAQQTPECRKLPWIPRSAAVHRTIANKLVVSSEKEQTELTKKTGYKQTELLRLSYFDTVRFHLIDPMHCLFEGVAKTVFTLWLKNGLLQRNALEKLDQRLGRVAVPAEFETPLKQMSSTYGFMKAVDWKNFTLYYSLYALPGLLSKPCWSYWQSFVLACRSIVKSDVSSANLQQFMKYYTCFIKEFINVHGVECVTPNMHMVMHLEKCILDYGPVYSFWCFPFERYNGMLGKYPTNGHRDLESQLMRRFCSFTMLNRLKHTVPLLFREVLLKVIDREYETDTPTDSSQADLFLQQKLLTEKRYSELLKHQNFVKLPSKKKTIHYKENSLQGLLEIYQEMFPGLNLRLQHLSHYVQSCKRIHFGNRSFSSNADPCSNKNQCVILGDCYYQGCDLNVRVGSVLKFITHEFSVGKTTISTTFAIMNWYAMNTTHDKELFQEPVVVVDFSSPLDLEINRFLPVQLILAQCVCGIDYTCSKYLVCIPAGLNVV